MSAAVEGTIEKLRETLSRHADKVILTEIHFDESKNKSLAETLRNVKDEYGQPAPKKIGEEVKLTSLVQILIFGEIRKNSDGNDVFEVVYRIVKNGQLLRAPESDSFNWTFRQLINKKIDAFGYEARARDYLKNALIRFATDPLHNVELKDVQFRVLTIDNDKYPRPIPYLYIKERAIKQLSFGSDIFQE